MLKNITAVGTCVSSENRTVYIRLNEDTRLLYSIAKRIERCCVFEWQLWLIDTQYEHTYVDGSFVSRTVFLFLDAFHSGHLAHEPYYG